jgi:DNA repair exonuclease SbcCD ATPase subunit
MAQLSESDVRIVEAKIGRKLTNREIITGELSRPDTRSHRELMAAAEWKPKMATPAKGKFDDAVESAKRAVDEERFAQLSPAQRRLAMMKDAQARDLREQADAKALREHLAKHAPQLDRLRALQDSIALDNSWSAADAESIRQAILQIEAGPNADADATAAAVAKPYKILAEKKQAIRNQSAVKRAELEAEVTRLDAELAAIGNVQVDPKLATLKTAKDAWAYFKEQFNADPNDDSPEANAARSHWSSLDKAEAEASESGAANYG